MKAMYEQIKANYQHMKAKLQQMKAKHQQLNIKYEHNIRVKYISEQIYARHLQRFDSTTSLNDQHAKSSTQFTDQELLLKIPTDTCNSVSSHTSNADKMTCRLSRARLFSTSRLHSRKKREREPSRIPYRKVIKFFGKTRLIRDAAKSYIKKCIPNSSWLKLVLSKANLCDFSERLVKSSKSTLLGKTSTSVLCS